MSHVIFGVEKLILDKKVENVIEVQSAEYHYPFYLNISQCLCIFYFKFVI